MLFWFFFSSNSTVHKHLYLGLQSLKSHRVQLSPPLAHFASVALLRFAGFLNDQPRCWPSLGRARGQRLNPGRLKPTYQEATTIWERQDPKYFPRTSCSNLISHKGTVVPDERVHMYLQDSAEGGFGFFPPKENAVKAHSLCRPGTKRETETKKSLFSKRHWQNNLLSARSLNII